MKKVVLITGCSSGFGYGMAIKFAESGYLTFASVRNLKSEGAKHLAKIAEENGLSLEIIPIDVTDQKSILKGVSSITKKVGRIDILINNAGYGYLGTIEETPIEDIESLYQTNILGVIRMVQAVIPVMRKKSSGLIINFSSINGIVPFPLFSVYSSTKFAIETLSEGLRFELKHFGITVVVVEPGSYLTNFSRNRKQPANLMSRSSPYRGLVNNFFYRYHKTHATEKKHVVSKTANPQEVVDAVFRITEEKEPKASYLVGWDAKKYYYLRKIIPIFLWEKLLHRTYNW
ncbi:oxidoreductase [soil metagenome]